MQSVGHRMIYSAKKNELLIIGANVSAAEKKFKNKTKQNKKGQICVRLMWYDHILLFM